MQRKINKPAYILVLTMLMIAMGIAMVTALIGNALQYQRTVRMATEKEQARALAFGGLQLALSQMSVAIAEDSKKGVEKEVASGQQQLQEPQKEKTSPEQKLLKQILPIINQWQTIEIDSKSFGIDGTLKIYISSEDGKFNISNFLEKKKKDQEIQSSEMGSQPKLNAPQEGKESAIALDELIKKELNISIMDALKKRRDELGRMPEDITELKINVPLFVDVDQDEKKKKQLFIMDIFTNVSNSGKLNPWLLSNGTKKILGLTNTEQQKSDELIKKFKPNLDWSKEWDNIFAQSYGKKFEQLPKEVSGLFSSQFEVSGFSVTTVAKVGKTIQKIYAIFIKDIPPSNLSPQSVLFKLNKLYWI